MQTQTELIENKLGKLPKSIKLCLSSKKFNNLTECYIYSLNKSIKKENKKMNRYYNIGNLVFTLLALTIEESKKNKLKKINKIFKNQDPFEEFKLKIITTTLSKLNIKNNSKKIKISNLKIRKYSKDFDKIVQNYADKEIFNISKNHFIQKIQTKKHPLVSDYILDVGFEIYKKKFEIVSPIIITIESIIHGIDDYVDDINNIKKQKKEILNIILGSILLLDYSLKIDFNNKLTLLIQNRPLKLFNLIKDCLIDLSIVPFIENESIEKIIQSKNIKNELEQTFKNLEVRTKGTRKTILSPTYIYLNKDNDIIELEELILIVRIQEMFLKDILDIKLDLKNKDYKGAAAIFKKYKNKKNEIKKRFDLVRQYYFSKAIEIIYKPNIYSKAKKMLIEKIIFQDESIRKKIKSL